MTGLAIPWRDTCSFSWLAYQLVYFIQGLYNGHKSFYTLRTGKKTGKSGMGSTPSKLWST